MIIHKSIVHVLDKNSDSPILNDYESKNSLEVDKFFQKIINRVSKDDDLRKGVFKNYNDNVVRNCCEQIIYDETTREELKKMKPQSKKVKILLIPYRIKSVLLAMIMGKGLAFCKKKLPKLFNSLKNKR